MWFTLLQHSQHPNPPHPTPPHHPTPRNESDFRWASASDGSSAFPALVPSSQEYNGPDYSHWVKAGSNPPEPNGQACAYAGNTAYYYFRGAVPGDRVLSGYIQTGTSKDVLGWVDVQCDSKNSVLHYICEFEGEASWLRHLQRLEVCAEACAAPVNRPCSHQVLRPIAATKPAAGAPYAAGSSTQGLGL